jgi:hypothetical protein
MMDTGVGTFTAIRLTLGTDLPAPLSAVRRLFEAVDTVSRMVEIQVTAHRDDEPYLLWRPASFQLVSVQLHSLELLIVATVGAWKGLPALLSFLQGLRDWNYDLDIKRSQARSARAAALSAEEEALSAGERRLGVVKREVDSEAVALVVKVNDDLWEAGHSDIRIKEPAPIRGVMKRRMDKRPTAKSSTEARSMRTLQRSIRDVETEQ